GLSLAVEEAAQVAQRRRLAVRVDQDLVGVHHDAPTVPAVGAEQGFQPEMAARRLLIRVPAPEHMSVGLGERVLPAAVRGVVVDHEEPVDAEPAEGAEAVWQPERLVAADHEQADLSRRGGNGPRAQANQRGARCEAEGGAPRQGAATRRPAVENSSEPVRSLEKALLRRGQAPQDGLHPDQSSSGHTIPACNARLRSGYSTGRAAPIAMTPLGCTRLHPATGSGSVRLDVKLTPARAPHATAARTTLRL